MFKVPLFTIVLLSATTALAALSPEEAAKLPPPAVHAVDFAKELKPLLETTCVKCHGKGKDKGGFSLETREAFIKGGETGAAAEPGNSAGSYVVELVAGIDPDEVMPKKGERWTPEQVGLLRAWIDQGMKWDPAITFKKPEPQNLKPRAVPLPEAGELNPIDRLLTPYYVANQFTPPAPVEDRIFARRVWLDVVGLLPSPEQLTAFLTDNAADKREQLVRTLLNDKRGYADHWLTFWNDLLRNDYKGVGFIDGGRRQISGWLHNALVQNLPYDQFVAQLVNPTRASEGFTKGILWRGTVNASMQVPMQAAQNVAQVFMGVNLKCASCHDSFINDWSLADAYGLAAIYSDTPLELVHCDKPTGKSAAARILYPELGVLDGKAGKPERLKRFAEIMTSRENGRLARTLVNRLWARLLGRGLVDPTDDMEQPAWSPELLDWLAEDFVTHKFDVKQTLELILTSKAYQLASVDTPNEKERFVFRGPLARRLTAEQFTDALSALSGEWARLPASLEFDFAASGLVSGVQMPKWIWTDEPVELGPQRTVVRAARGALADATNKLVEAQKKTEEAAANGGGAIEPARAAVEQALAAMNAAQSQLKSATEPRPGPAPGQPGVIPEGERHRVIFRKKLTLKAAPTEAYAALLASQRFEVHVNGKEAKPIQRDGARNGRIALLDLKPHLKAGDNVIVLDISSHTEKQMNDIEKKEHPASLTHYNKQSGLAFYARCVLPGGEMLQLITDESWRVRRNPDADWKAVSLTDADWAVARPLPPEVAPVDEGPGLTPITRQDFANLPVELGPQLSPAVSTAAQAGQIRAPLLAADPLQIALNRPNREQVMPVRGTLPTTLQALELTNGSTLDARLKETASRFVPEAAKDPAVWLTRVYRHALSRDPAEGERQIALELLGATPTAEAVADLLWTLVNLPEFQLIH